MNTKKLLNRMGGLVKCTAVAVIGAAAAFASGEAGAATCTYDGAWDTTPSSAEDEIVIVSGDLTWGTSLPPKVKSWTQTGGTVTFATTYAATFPLFEVSGDVSLTGGAWTHPANSTKETYRLCVSVGGNLTVAEGASITAYAKGYTQGGAGKSVNGVAGAAHGGRGYNQYDGTRTICFGSIREPVRIGSTGGNSGRAAGGAIRLTVGGTFSLGGTLCADGHYSGGGYFVGSGGSVWVTAREMTSTASAVISANAGKDSTYAGGGGRVSLCLTGAGATFADFKGLACAYGALNGSGVAYTGAGTVYFETAADGVGKGRLVIDGKDISSKDSWFTELIFADQVDGFDPRTIEVKNNGRLVTIDEGALAPTNLVFSNNGRLVINSACPVDLSNVSFSGTVPDDGLRIQKPVALDFGTGLTIDGGTLWIMSSGVTCNEDADLEIKSGGVLNDSYPFVLHGDLTVRSGGTITHTVNTKDTDYRVDLTVEGDMTLESGAVVTAKTCGYPKRVGIGSSTTASWGGGCHGGRGYGHSSGSGSAGNCYGSVTRPTELGSGTADGTDYTNNGGGSVHLTVMGKLTHNGAIDADGGNGYGGLGGLGSSPGGSVWIVAGTLEGAGDIRANAKYPDTASHNVCGGGRVSVWLTGTGADFSQYTGATTAYGTRSSTTAAASAGTVYLKTGDQAADGGTLILDNGGVSSSQPTDIGQYVTDTAVGTVRISADSKLRLREGSTLTVSGDIVNNGTFTAVDGSTLAFAGTGESSVNCSLTVPKFVCRSPGKKISFADGTTVTVGEQFAVEGAEGHLVELASKPGEGTWALVVNGTAEQSVKRVKVARCDASAGAEIVANDSEADGATTNWKIVNIVPGQTITWNGSAGSSGWLLPANWDLGRAPVETDVVVIGPADVQPSLSAAAKVSRLTVASGAALTLDGYDLTVTGALAVAGCLIASGSENIAVGGDVTLAAKGLTKATSTFTLGGSAAQAFDPMGNEFHRLVFANTSAAGVDIRSSFSTYYLTADSSVATRLAFGSGVTAEVGVALRFACSAPSGKLGLVPATSGQTWNLAVRGTADVSDVAVSGSQATGNVICASDSTDDGNNDNWLFGTFKTARWTGTSGSDFNTPGNWEGGSVPDADTAVVIDSANPVVLSTSVQVRELVIGGTAVTSVSIKAPLSVTAAMVLDDHAMVTADAKVTVGGSVIMKSGSVLTHSDNTTSAVALNQIDLAVGGNVVIDAGAKVSGDEKGYRSGGPGRATSSGGSYGGTGGTHGTAADCYGSVFFPTNCGSSSADSNGYISSGGGIVRMTVAGSLVVNGTISVKGKRQNTFYSGSGGSVWLTCARLQGAGSVTANGGITTSSYRGAGGRIALYLTDPTATLDDFTGEIGAYPGEDVGQVNYTPAGAPGTFYVETAQDRPFCGEVRIVNHPNANEFGGNSHGAYVQYPSLRQSADPAKGDMRLVLKGYARLSLTRNAKVGSLEVLDGKPKVFLNGHVLKINQHKPKGWVLPSYVDPGEDAEGNPGRIEWKQGFSVIVR